MTVGERTFAPRALTVVVRELHIAYDREATIDDELVGCVRVSAASGQGEDRGATHRRRGRDLVVARAWAVQLFVQDGAVIEFPEFYWEAIAAAEGRVIPLEPRVPETAWGPPH